jgi:hypothetical protein
VARPAVGGNNSTGSSYAGAGSTSNGTGPLLAAAEDASANANILTILSKKPDDIDTGNGANALKALVPAGNDDVAVTDAPLKRLLDDASTEVGRLIGIDNNNANQGGQQCRNTVVILVTGGGEGTITSEDPATKAATFLSTWAGRHVPIYVVALAPASADRATLQAVASESGGRYFEVTKTQIDAALSSTMWSAAVTGAPAGTVVVPEVVRAINVAIQAGFENFADLNTAATSAWVATAGVPTNAGEFNPETAALVPTSEFQVTTPIIGTVNMIGARDASGALLTPDPLTVKDRANNVIPQRSTSCSRPRSACRASMERCARIASTNPCLMRRSRPAGNSSPTAPRSGPDARPAPRPGPCSALSTNDRNLLRRRPTGRWAFTARRGGAEAAEEPHEPDRRAERQQKGPGVSARHDSRLDARNHEPAVP